MEIFTSLGISWQQLIAQIVNFAIVVGVLTYFIYKPLLKVIDDRRERIKKSMEDVDAIDNQKKETERMKQDVLAKADKQAGEILEKAKKQAQETKDQLVTAAKREADQILEKGRAQLEADRIRVYTEVHQNVTQLIVDLTQKVLEREFTPADQKRLIASLEKELPKSHR